MVFFPYKYNHGICNNFLLFLPSSEPYYFFFLETIPTIKKLLSKSSSSCLFHPCSPLLILIGKFCFSYLLNTNADVKSFKARFNIPHDVNISYCHEGDIEDQRLPRVVFFNFLYGIRGILKNRYHLQTRNTMLRLISCLPDSNRNSTRSL